MLAGSSKSTDGDVTGSHGGYDAWIVKLGADDVGVTELEMGTAFTLYPNPATDAVTIRFDRTSSAPLQLKLFDAAGRSLRPELKEYRSWAKAMCKLLSEHFRRASMSYGSTPATGGMRGDW